MVGDISGNIGFLLFIAEVGVGVFFAFFITDPYSSRISGCFRNHPLIFRNAGRNVVFQTFIAPVGRSCLCVDRIISLQQLHVVVVRTGNASVHQIRCQIRSLLRKHL